MSTNGSIYILNAGSAESEQGRLNRQHHLFVDIMQGDLLPPHVTSSLTASPTPPKIVEIATGSAIWLTEIAKTLPSDAELVGLDFDTSKFPSASSLASNISLRQTNMFEPFPDDLIGKFDVVNVRLIIFALKEGYGIDLMKNLMTLLRPGGYVHLTSIAPPSQAWFKFQDLDFKFAKKVGRDTNIPSSIQSYIEQAGYVECDDKAYPSNKQQYTDKKKDWTARMNLQIRTLAAQTLAGMVELGGVEGLSTAEEAAELMALCQEEFVDRAVHMCVIRAWGRKPEAS